MSNRNSLLKHCHEANLHSFDKVPLSWQVYIQDNRNKLMENMPRYIEDE